MGAAKDIIELARYGESLKRIMRTGWSLAGVNRARPESVGEHSYGTALLSLLISKELIRKGINVDLGKVASIALIHDIPEALISDIPQTAALLGGETLSEGKRDAEREAMSIIVGKSSTFKEWLENLWEDAEKESLLESRIVICADILDMLLHAVTLEKSGVSPQTLDQFFVSSHRRLDQYEIPIVIDIFWVLYQEHLVYAEQVGVTLARMTRS